ncbi:hypothetical protein X769_04930 [Mesorhizobium sp. LSJC268A00]|nr:hypothetical protein X769_04930 [Mesorhizobium sp. LSJC268A00]
MPADAGSNRRPESGAFFQRDRGWHPPALTPDYKTSVLRSPHGEFRQDRQRGDT